MKAYEGYAARKSVGREYIPINGYVVKIMDAKEQHYDWGDVLLVSFDIAEGAYKDFFRHDYQNQTAEDRRWRGTYRMNIPSGDGSEKDGWRKRSFENDMFCVEDSNPGYVWDWDETKLKGKLVGVLYRNKEWEFNGRTGWAPEAAMLAAAADVRSGNFKLPKDRPLPAKTSQTPAFNPLETDDDLPF